MPHMKIAEILQQAPNQQQLTVKGWVRTFRANRFIALNDGSCLSNLQCVVDFEQTPETVLKNITTGAALSIEGTLVLPIQNSIPFNLKNTVSNFFVKKHIYAYAQPLLVL